MKHKLIILLSVIALIVPQTMRAQEDASSFWDFHEKDSNPYITVDSEPENIIRALFDAEPNGDEFVLKEGTWMELERKVTDSFGNVHVTYSQKSDPNEFSDYQLVLHFRPNGSLYYRNGTLVIQGKVASQNAKARKPVSWIPAERASIIATGSPTSETVKAIANHKGKPRDAYKVKDGAGLQHVYVDAHSGDVLYTIPILRSFAPWGDVKGSAVTLSANTSYDGVQELTVMQTDKGYILRDPVRNILTVDATDVLTDTEANNFPEAEDAQIRKILENSDDVLFADKEELLTQQYTTSIRGVTIWLDPKMEEVPESFNLRVYCLDDIEHNFVMDIINTDISDIEWTHEGDRMKCSLTFDECPQIPPFGYIQVVKLTIGNYEYLHNDIMRAGNKTPDNLYDKNWKMTDALCLFDIEANATQPAIDVHWATQKIWDMYDEYYGIKGCDGKGMQSINIVNPSNHIPLFNGTLPLNSMAKSEEMNDHNGEPSYVMIYGMGSSGAYKPITPFDVTAHEFTHNVTAGSCNNLLYQNESGALNEAMADCMAMVAEYYVYGEPSWIMGENVTLYCDNMRNLANPWYSGCKDGEMTYYAQPKYYYGQFWFDYTNADPNAPNSDHGGVHYNSGVFNYLFYLLCEGGMGLTNEMNETRDIYPVGMDRMKDILFHDMRYYNASLCNYAEIADNLMITIEDIYGNDEATVSDLQNKFLTAYKHVGMAPEMIHTSITTPLASTHSTHSTPFNLTSTHSTPSTTPTYNLYGIPVGDGYKGIVIRNGEKVAQGHTF